MEIKNHKIKQKIKNIINLMEKRNKLLIEVEGLNDYKNKVKVVRQKYGKSI